jgi:hypothetical protein
MPHERWPPDDPREWIIRVRSNLVRAQATWLFLGIAPTTCQLLLTTGMSRRLPNFSGPAGTRWHLVALDAKPREVTIETKEAALATKHRRTASANGVEIVERLSREEGKRANT